MTTLRNIMLTSSMPELPENNESRPKLKRAPPSRRGLYRSKSANETNELARGLRSHSSHHQFCRTLKTCKICTKKALRLTARDLQAVNPHEWGDNGLIELIHSIRNQKLYHDDANAANRSVELEQADTIVARAADKFRDFDQQRQANLKQYAPSDMSLYPDNLRAMGKLEWDELKIGALLGVGGFSNVSEICGFTLNSNNSSPYSSKEQVARKFLELHAKRTTPMDNASTRSVASKSLNHNESSHHTPTTNGSTTVSYRYALKHLRPKLAEIYDQRTFHCAAVDLIGEAHVLLSLQHPNIIKIRGFAAAGPEGYKTKGHHNGYFLILDLLPETMEQRLVAWRKKVKKYLSVKRSLVSKVLLKKNRETASRKLDALLEERYFVAYEICGAMEYLHQRRMMNRDLKVANIGFDIRGDVKLFDFGLSRWLPTSLLTEDKATPKALLDENFHMSSVGTKLYMAPEVMLREAYSTKADVYSFGIVLWEMLCLCDPEWNKAPKDKKDVRPHAQKAYDNVPLCPCWPLPLQRVLKRCISPTPSERPTFTEIRTMFREELMVEDADDAAEFAEDDQLRYASDDDARVGNHDDDDDDSDEAQDSVGDLKMVGSNSSEIRRRSTFVLDFKNLGWLSSDDSLRYDANSSAMEVGPNWPRESASTTRTSASSLPFDV